MAENLLVSKCGEMVGEKDARMCAASPQRAVPGQRGGCALGSAGL